MYYSKFDDIDQDRKDSWRNDSIRTIIRRREARGANTKAQNVRPNYITTDINPRSGKIQLIKDSPQSSETSWKLPSSWLQFEEAIEVSEFWYFI
jgi:hypothetical protein